MKIKTPHFAQGTNRVISVMATLLLVFAPVSAHGAGLTSRSNVMSTSQAGVVASHVISATTATGSSIGSIKFEFCKTVSGACVIPDDMVTTGATLTAQSGATGFTINNGTNGAPYLTRVAAMVTAGTALSYTLGNVLNPSVTNSTFYVRITTYSGTNGATGPVDNGTVAASTATPIQLTGVTPEILIFCVGITITSDCTTVSGNSIDFGDFDPLTTRTATSVMQATTNAGNGYTVTVNGTTLASGTNTIPALVTQTASNTGQSQFGMNLRDNATPNVGSNVSGAGSGSATANYGTADAYRFVTGDAVATAGAPSDANTFTSSYIVNIGGAQPAGVYTATMTYICTASF